MSHVLFKNDIIWVYVMLMVRFMKECCVDKVYV